MVSHLKYSDFVLQLFCHLILKTCEWRFAYLARALVVVREDEIAVVVYLYSQVLLLVVVLVHYFLVHPNPIHLSLHPLPHWNDGERLLMLPVERLDGAQLNQLRDHLEIEKGEEEGKLMSRDAKRWNWTNHCCSVGMAELRRFEMTVFS